jgi:hypothetical protein
MPLENRASCRNERMTVWLRGRIGGLLLPLIAPHTWPFDNFSNGRAFRRGFDEFIDFWIDLAGSPGRPRRRGKRVVTRRLRDC